MITLMSGPGALMTKLRNAKKQARHPGDAGIDLYPSVTRYDDIKKINAKMGMIWSIPTGVHILIPEGCVGMIVGRSSSVEKLEGCQVITGVIDHGYTGEYFVRILVPELTQSINRYELLHQQIWKFAREEVALAQLLILPFVSATLVVRDRLPETPRGANGFGSTDKYNGKQGLSVSCVCGTRLQIGQVMCPACAARNEEILNP